MAEIFSSGVWKNSMVYNIDRSDTAIIANDIVSGIQ